MSSGRMPADAVSACLPSAEPKVSAPAGAAPDLRGPAGTARAYYNEMDPYAAQWLRNLIAAGHIAPGDVDERSVIDVRPDDVAGYRQCHWFAGIGGWSLALRLAGWPDERPVWTGSAPCQPFSAAGRQRGFADARHLWPVWLKLIGECRPAKLFGEQVASAADWLALVRGDLEALGYAVGAMPVEAASAGAFHRRDRYWFVADADFAGRQQRAGACALGTRYPEPADGRHLADADRDGLEGSKSTSSPDRGRRPSYPGSEDHSWTSLVWLDCRDGRRRPTQPGLRPLAHGIPGRVGQLRAAGNAIYAPAAAAFIEAAADALDARRLQLAGGVFA